MTNGNETIIKKRGRKSKKELEESKKILEETCAAQNIVIELENETIEPETKDNDESIDDNKPILKKRGRKPKGGKIVQQVTNVPIVKETKPNVILHLKCSLKDINNGDVYDALDSYTFKPTMNMNLTNDYENVAGSQQISDSEDDEDLDNDKKDDIRNIWKKLKTLEHNLHINNITNKKSACFWDTCDFDNPPVYIPKHFINDTYHVYGCFCSPECAVAHLMKENIDSSTKFERYYLLNNIYGKIYDYKKSIKPAPNPNYMLDKYLGNLTIQEYRSLLRNERLFLVIDKPLTRIMPELHEDNDDFIINNKIIPSNNYQLKKKSNKPTKSNILNERFGLA
jgi:hypothetical protein